MTQALMIVSVGGGVYAHDPSTYGGLFRSRNLGGTWLNADVGLFVNAALTVALDPRDQNHLLMGTDSGLLRSHNGGRSWLPEARDRIFGSVFAIAFSPSGESVMAAAPSGVFRFHEGQWSRASLPEGAVPARALAFGAARDRVYLLGDSAIFTSDDDGQSFHRVANDWAPDAKMTTLGVIRRSPEMLFAVIGGRLMTSDDGGQRWHERIIAVRGSRVDTSALDPYWPTRLWAASADQIYMSNDLGLNWRAVGRRLPEPETSVRGIAADQNAATLVVTTHRGLYRSEDGGSNWALIEGSLPIHLEAGPLVRDERDPKTLYAVYSLMPYPEVWRMALQGGNLLSRSDPVSLAGGLAFVLLVMIGGGLLVVWLARRRSLPATPRGLPS
ncbi:MAG TPA: hypothetical protein VEK55_07550 [Xanthobacteraceae bacterium]|nr:hypothetical protein [Xanthobacteraceae bacterium]